MTVQTARGFCLQIRGCVLVEEDKLSAVLSDFARTLVTDFPIQGILEHLVSRIVEILPISGAGVTLIAPGRAPQYIAASDDAALRFEHLQSKLGEGPCLVAYESGQSVSIPDLSKDDRFPKFAPEALKSGLVAVFTFPLRPGEGSLGALDLYRDTPGPLDDQDMAVAQTLADVAAAYLVNAQSRDEARATSDRFHHSAMHDPLTELPNRALLQQRLEHAAQRARRSNANAAILFADLDRFKQVNDQYGHQVGDELLKAVAERLSAVVRPGDTLARVSGDEFVFLCEDVVSPADAESVAARIDEAFKDPFVLKTVQLNVTASVGMAFAGPGEEISDQLIVKADSAMYEAKRRGTGEHRIIDLRADIERQDRNTMRADLSTALANDKLELVYQPVVNIADGVMTGVEALLRWTDEERGPVSTLLMIGIAEESGLISDIGEWALERACRDRGRWLDQYPDLPMTLSVNVSPRQLMSSDFAGTVAGVLALTGMDSSSLILEMTENIFIEDVERAMIVLADLRVFGVRLALDDFGTGYSSLSYLRRLPIQIVKIDQSFIANMGHGSMGGAIVASITDMAHVLGLAVSAEGVETQGQHDEIVAMGCDTAQGFFYDRPMSAAGIGAQLSGESACSPYVVSAN